MGKISDYLELTFADGDEDLVTAFSGSNRKVKLNNSSFNVERSRHPVIFTDFLGTGAVESLAPFTTNLSTPSVDQIPSEANHPGILRLSTGNSAVGLRETILANWLLFNGGETVEACFRQQAPASIVHCGFFDAALFPPPSASGTYIAAHINSSNILRGYAANGISSAQTPTSYTISNGTWYRIKVGVRSGVSAVDFVLYDENQSVLWADTVSSNIPSGTSTRLHVFAINPGDVDWLAFYNPIPLTR